MEAPDRMKSAKARLRPLDMKGVQQVGGMQPQSELPDGFANYDSEGMMTGSENCVVRCLSASMEHSTFKSSYENLKALTSPGSAKEYTIRTSKSADFAHLVADQGRCPFSSKHWLIGPCSSDDIAMSQPTSSPMSSPSSSSADFAQLLA